MGALYMTQELGSSEALGALAFAAFAVTMAIARFAADPLRARLGNVVLVRGGSLIAATGLGLGLLVHEPAAAIAGFALLGLGLAPVVPIAFSAAGDLTPAHWPPRGPRGNARLRGLGGGPDHDRLARGGDEPARRAGPGGPAGACDRRVGAKRATLRAPTNWRTQWLRSRRSSFAMEMMVAREFIPVVACRRRSGLRGSSTKR